MSLPRADQLDIAMYWAARKLGITRKFDMGITDYTQRREAVRDHLCSQCMVNVVAGRSRHGVETWGDWWKRITGQELK